jgi:hypothetical protein
VVATVDGRAYFEFAQLLKGLGIKYVSELPWRVKPSETRLLLTTAAELPKGYEGDSLLFEDLKRNQVADSAAVVSVLFEKRKDSLLVGLDPGGFTGVSCIYRGFPLLATVCDSLEKAVDTTMLLLRLDSREKLVRIGAGDRAKADYLARAVSSVLPGVRIELVDEKGTTKEARGPINDRGRRDATSAFIIARKRGLPYR